MGGDRGGVSHAQGQQVHGPEVGSRVARLRDGEAGGAGEQGEGERVGRGGDAGPLRALLALDCPGAP